MKKIDSLSFFNSAPFFSPFSFKKKPFIGELKHIIIAALEHCEAEGKIKIFSGIAMVSHGDGNSAACDRKIENSSISDVLLSFHNERHH
jgi:hypothetical protein